MEYNYDDWAVWKIFLIVTNFINHQLNKYSSVNGINIIDKSYNNISIINFI